MRRKFCEGRDNAFEKMPWAKVIVKVSGGCRGFESHDGYLLWLESYNESQKMGGIDVIIFTELFKKYGKEIQLFLNTQKKKWEFRGVFVRASEELDAVMLRNNEERIIKCSPGEGNFLPDHYADYIGGEIDKICEIEGE